MMIVWSWVATEDNIESAVDLATGEMQEWIRRREEGKLCDHIVKLQSQLVMHDGEATYILTAVFESA